MKPSMVPMMVPADEARERNARAALHPRPLVSIFAPAAPAETDSAVVRRMKDLITSLVTSQGSISRDDLERCFDRDQIDAHYRKALKASGVHRLAATW